MAASDSLAPYVLKRVEELKEEILENSTDPCYKVKVDGVLRIAKKPHPNVLACSENAKVWYLANFKKECDLLSKLRHPNIVQFIGVYYGNGDKDEIALVMEKVEYQLATFLKEKPHVNLSTKLSILHDVTYGLVYLHEYNPPIIHRDLSAPNILLTTSYRAKIGDLGVAKLMDKAAMKAESYASAPGQMFYMPPEALVDKAMYTSKLDIFSFGHLSLHTLLGGNPEVYEVDLTPEMLQQRTVQITKRKTSLDRVGSDHCLYPLITQCLLDNPDRRPTTREINSSIGRLVEAHCSTISGDENSCSNPRHQALQHQVYLLQEEFEESKKRVTSFEKTVAHLQQEKNSALEQCSLAKVEAEIFKSDFEEERRDRTKAQGLLADFQNKKSIAAMYKEQDTLLRQERDGAIQERNYLKRELSKAKVELAQADGLKEGLKHHINETEEMIRQRDYYRELYEKVKPLESEVEISKKEITQLRAHIESLMRKGKLKEKQLKAAEEQEDAFAVKQEKEILSKDLETKASRSPIGNEQPKIHNKVESSYPIRQSKHNEQGFDVMLNPNASGCRFDRSGSEYHSFPTLEIGDLSEAERTGLKEPIKKSSSIHGGEDKDVRRDQSYLNLEVGDFSEAERTGLKESSIIDVGEDKDMRHVYQEQEDVEDMYKAMEDLGHERQVMKVTDVHMRFDTNLICPICQKQFRIGEIQKYKKHVDDCV